MIRRRTPAILILMGMLFLAGCGYQFRADGRPVGTDLRSVAIPLVESTSSNLGFEADFTKIIREEFQSKGDIPVVPTDTADAVLTGRIYEVKTRPIAFDSQEVTVSGQRVTYEQTDRRRLIVKLDVKLTDRRTGTVIWRDTAMEDKAAFDVGTDPLVNRFNQTQALERIARRLAKRMFLKTMERF